MASEKGHKLNVQDLMKYNASVNKSTIEEYSPLHVACRNGHTETVKLLLDNNALINKQDDRGRTPLYEAAVYNRVDTMKLLLDYQPAINVCEYSLPLLAACQLGHVDAASMLLLHGADHGMWLPF